MSDRQPWHRLSALVLAGAACFASRPAGGQSAPPEPPRAASATADLPAADSPRSLAEAGHLLALDARAVFGAPLRWDGRDWERFGLLAAGVGGVALADRGIRNRELADHGRTADDVARIAEPFGAQDSIAVLGGFYLGGLLAGDARARNVGFDGAVASLTSAAVTSVLKEIVGRKRPNQSNGPFDFRPFGGSASFPSGHATQAFAVASVIATSYDSGWVTAGSYGLAALVGFARVHHQAHFASDVVAGAAIGTAAGRTVVGTNRPRGRRRARVALGPALGPRDQPGLALVASF